MERENRQVLPVKEIIRLCMNRNVSFFAYRLPGERSVTIGIQTSKHQYPVDLTDEKQLPGFVFTPFAKTETCTGRFIRADILLSDLSAEHFSLTKLEEMIPLFLPESSSVIGRDTAEPKESYLQTIGRLVSRIQATDLRKVVYARQIESSACNKELYCDIFKVLLERFPDAFVSLVHLSGEETWMGASPELLLSNIPGKGFKTIALAGTKPVEKKTWGKKEIEEQEMVRLYVERILADQQITAIQSERYTRTAGNVSHLCTSFSSETALPFFRLSEVVSALHPTPAVCGLPKEEALQLILESEPFDRRYYAGYLGPVSSEGVRLFVNLRCFRLDAAKTVVYVGGGITQDSDPVEEWNETCLKAQRLLDIITNRSK